MTRNFTRAALAIAVLAAGLCAALQARAADPVSAAGRTDPIQVVGSDSGSRFVQLGIGKSLVLDLPRDIKDVLVADPKIANVVMRTSRRVYMIGNKVGQTNIYFFDADGRQIAGLDVAVTRDLNGIRAALRKALPTAVINVDGIGEDGVLLTGMVANAAESQLAYNLATTLLYSRNAAVSGTSTGSTQSSGGGSSTTSTTTASTSDHNGNVVNNITIRGRDQVMLKVTVAEVQRDIIKQLGIDLNGTSVSFGNAILNFNNSNPFTALGQPLVAGNGVQGSFKGITATLNAMERAGVIRTLAEPTLTAISGESANFLAGGEFPVPAGYTCDPTTHVCQLAIQFKKFGVGLNFTPVVLSEGRISLKVLTEVSELSNENSIQLVQGQSTQTIPAIKTRRAETTVEIPSGGALAMAGMIQEQTKHNISGLPGLMQLPVLGTLFKSRDFVSRQTELMVIVTPYIARSVAQKDLSRPDDGFQDPSDPAAVLLGRLNRIYGAPGNKAPAAGYQGKYGFILD